MGGAGSGRRVVATVVVVVAWAGLGMGAPAVAGGKNLTGVVNLNTAEPRLLVLLPGVGGAKAAQIVAYRTRHPFRTIDELVRIKGIGRRMVRALRPHLAVTGPSTASPTPRSESSTPPLSARTTPPETPPTTPPTTPQTTIATMGPRSVAPSPAHHLGPGHLPSTGSSRPLRALGATAAIAASRAGRSPANHCPPRP